MSINRDMKSYRLQKEETVRTPSGAEKQKWIDMGGVKAAVYKLHLRPIWNRHI